MKDEISVLYKNISLSDSYIISLQLSYDTLYTYL